MRIEMGISWVLFLCLCLCEDMCTSVQACMEIKKGIQCPVSKLIHSCEPHCLPQFRAVVSRAEVGLTICKSRRTSMALQAFYATQSHSHVKFPNLGTLRWMRMIVTFSWPAFMSLYSASLKVFSPDHVLIKILHRLVLVHSLTRRNEEVISDRDSLLNWFHMHLCLKCCYGDNFKATQRMSIYSSLGLFN